MPLTIKPIASSSKGNAYLLDDGVAPLLLECGIPLPQIRESLPWLITRLAACLITHEHKDHCKAAKLVAGKGIPIICSWGTAGAIGLAMFRVMVAEAGLQKTVMPLSTNRAHWTILPFETVHDAAEPLGYLIYHHPTKSKILFAIDTQYIKHSFKGLTHIMIEANYSKELLLRAVEGRNVPHIVARRMLLNHQSIETAIAFLKKTDMTTVREIYLMHLSAGHSHEEDFKGMAQEATGRPVKICEE